jgi:hypothetical protein
MKWTLRRMSWDNLGTKESKPRRLKVRIIPN